MPGVSAQIHQDLMNLCGVGQNLRRGRIEGYRQLYARRDGGPQQIEGFAHHRLKGHHGPWQCLLMAEREDLMDEAGGSVAGFQNSHKVRLYRMVGSDLFRGQLGIAKYGSEDIIEVMCDTAGQFPNRFHFLHLADLILKSLQGSLRLFALRNVAYKRIIELLTLVQNIVGHDFHWIGLA